MLTSSKIARNFVDVFDVLLDAYKDIGESMPLLEKYKELFSQKTYMQDTLVLIYEDIFNFHLKALRYFQRPVWQKLFHATWKTFMDRLQVIKELTRHRRLLESNATLASFEEFLTARDNWEREKKLVEEREDLRRRLEVQRWLAATSAQISHQNACAIRAEFPNSGRWLLQNHKLQNWADPARCPMPSLWMHGIPGAGKTILVSLVIEELQKQTSAHVVFFYCKHGNRNQGAFIDIAKSMLSQLLVVNEDLLPFMYEQSSRSGEATLESLALAETLLATALESIENLFVIIDGLDECAEHEEQRILRWFKPFIEEHSPKPLFPRRCMFISQNDKTISKFFGNSNTIRITESDNCKDIESFTDFWSWKIKAKFNLSEPDRMAMAKKIEGNACGMFLYAKLVCKNLYDQATSRRLKDEISDELFPEGLDAAYARIVYRIFQEGPVAQRAVAKCLLSWLVCARRPMTWGEIQSANSMEFEDRTMDFEGQRLRASAKELCESLVDISVDGTVDLVHSTTRYYLTRKGLVDQDETHLSLALHCLEYLSWPCFDQTILEDDIVRYFLEGYYIFGEYAMVHWADHLEECIPGRESINDKQTIRDIVQLFLDAHCIASNPSFSSQDFEDWHVLADCDFFPNLCRSITTARTHLAAADEPAALDLLDTLKRVRATSESKFIALPTLLRDFYGKTPYKCPRIYCKFFHKGFADIKERDMHIGKHDRPYHCTEPRCNTVPNDFAMQHELNQHMVDAHGASSFKADEFPAFHDDEALKNTLVTTRYRRSDVKSGRQNEKKLECPECHQTFHRKFNMENHMKIHTGIKPFTCPVCSKSFTRKSDCNRHEETVHAVVSFVCSPPAGTDGTWGCGKGFVNLAVLRSHFLHGDCIKDLLKEDERAGIKVTGVRYLPTAVLRAYPELGNLP